MTFHGPQAYRVAQNIHDKAHAVNDYLATLHDSYESPGQDLDYHTVMKLGAEFHTLASRYHQVTGTELHDDEMQCNHCGKEF